MEERTGEAPSDMVQVKVDEDEAESPGVDALAGRTPRCRFADLLSMEDGEKAILRSYLGFNAFLVALMTDVPLTIRSVELGHRNETNASDVEDSAMVQRWANLQGGHPQNQQAQPLQMLLQTFVAALERLHKKGPEELSQGDEATTGPAMRARTQPWRPCWWYTATGTPCWWNLWTAAGWTCEDLLRTELDETDLEAIEAALAEQMETEEKADQSAKEFEYVERRARGTFSSG